MELIFFTFQISIFKMKRNLHLKDRVSFSQKSIPPPLPPFFKKKAPSARTTLVDEARIAQRKKNDVKKSQMRVEEERKIRYWSSLRHTRDPLV